MANSELNHYQEMCRGLVKENEKLKRQLHKNSNIDFRAGLTIGVVLALIVIFVMSELLNLL